MKRLPVLLLVLIVSGCTLPPDLPTPTEVKTPTPTQEVTVEPSATATPTETSVPTEEPTPAEETPTPIVPAPVLTLTDGTVEYVMDYHVRLREGPLTIYDQLADANGNLRWAYKGTTQTITAWLDYYSGEVWACIDTEFPTACRVWFQFQEGPDDDPNAHPAPGPVGGGGQ